jgi:hypothetical protein
LVTKYNDHLFLAYMFACGSPTKTKSSLILLIKWSVLRVE